VSGQATVQGEANRQPSADDRMAVQLRGFGPVGLAAILVTLVAGNVRVGGALVVPAGALLVLAWRWRSRTPWHEIGYARPKNWIAVLAIGLAFGIAFKVLMKALVMPLFGADPVNHVYHFLAGRPDLLAEAIFSMIVAGGFGEETLYRGFLFERSRKFFGSSAWTVAATVLLTAMVFASGHYGDQGLTGVEQAVITGTVFGTIFAVTGRIWMPMVAHAAFDLTAIAMIYGNLESRVAHLVFK